MRPLQYHHGQIAVQEEANSRALADRMAGWVGPAAEFAERADLLIFSYLDSTRLRLSAVSGRPPLARAVGPSAIGIEAADLPLPEGKIGGLAINLQEARRVRLNGMLQHTPDGPVLEVDEAFTLCRKYLARSVPTEHVTHIGTSHGEPLGLDDPRLIEVVRHAETTFMASVAPDGAPDVAHRGGAAGFLAFDLARGVLAWPEYVGDGVFKSAGNVRATPTVTMLVPDLQTGDAFAFHGQGTYTNLRLMRSPRRDPLVQDREAFPAQGRMEVAVDLVERLPAFLAPRRMMEHEARVTSASSVNAQAPQ